MVKIAWKVINGYGPYAYLQDTLKTGGKVVSKHLAYLGKAGAGGLFPGKYFQVAAVSGFPGGAVRVPMVPDETLDSLKPNPKSSVEWIAAQVLQGVPRKEITLKETGKTAPAQGEPAAWKPQVPPYYKDLKVTGGPEAEKGEPAISSPDVAKLEKAAATGEPKELKVAIKDMTEEVRHLQKKAAVLNAGSEMLTQVQEHAKAVQQKTAAVAPNSKVKAPKDAPGKPLIDDAIQAKPEEATGPEDPLKLQAAIGTPHGEKTKAVQKEPTKGGAPTFKVTTVPKDAKGKPLITKANIKKLEAAAATGDITHLHVIAVGLNDMMKSPAKKKAIAAAFEELQGQHYAHAQAKQDHAEAAAGQAPNTAMPNKEAVAPNFKVKVPKDAPGKPLIDDANPAKPEEKTEAAQQAPATKVAPTFKVNTVPKDAKGKPLVSKANIKKLEAAAATGDPGDVITAVGVLMEKEKAKPQAQMQQMQALFAVQQELLVQIQAHKKVSMGQVAGLLAQLQAKKAEEKPPWTKLEDAKGSTKGGVYENQEGGEVLPQMPPDAEARPQRAPGP